MAEVITKKSSFNKLKPLNLKAKHVFSTILFSVLFIRCGENIATPKINATAKKNDQIWEAEATAYYDSSFGDTLITIVNRVRNPGGFLREMFTFKQIRPYASEYNLRDADRTELCDCVGALFGTFVADGDVIDKVYVSDTTTINKFVVVSFDNTTMELIGSFYGTFLEMKIGQDTTPQDKIEFREGKIKVIIE